MVISAPLAKKTQNTKISPKTQYECLEKLQGINPMFLNARLADSYPNSCSETPKCHQNHEMITLKIFNGQTQW